VKLAYILAINALLRCLAIHALLKTMEVMFNFFYIKANALTLVQKAHIKTEWFV